MLPSALLLPVVVVAILLGFVLSRPRSPYNRRPAYRVVSEAPCEVDYIVIGAGPAGLAACQTLLRTRTQPCSGGAREDRTAATAPVAPSILLIEAGDETLPTTALGVWRQRTDRDRLLYFAPDAVALPKNAIRGPVSRLSGTCRDYGYVVPRPLRAPSVTAPLGRASAADTATVLAHTPYIRAAGVGGTTLVDWGLRLPSIFSEQHNESDVASPGPPLPPRLAHTPDATLCPLSWAFAAAMLTRLAARRSAASKAWQRANTQQGVLFPVKLRVDCDGRRLPLAAELLCGAGHTPTAEQLACLSVLPRHTVRALELVPDTAYGSRVVAVRCTSCHDATDGGTATADVTSSVVKVRVGVVLAAGVLHTPRLLYRSLTTFRRSVHEDVATAVELGPSVARLRDAVALPVIYQTQRGLAAERGRVGDLQATLAWWLVQRGAFQTPLTDALGCLPLPELGAEVQLWVFFFPFGGRDAQRFYAMGWDRTLGVFSEAITFLLVVQGLDGLDLPLPLSDSMDEKDVPRGVSGATMGGTPPWRPLTLPASAQNESTKCGSGLPAGVRERLVTALGRGLALCRELAQTAPLAHLLTGWQAVDCGLLVDDPARAVRLARLLHTSVSRLNRAMRQELAELMRWSARVAETETYTRAYITKHAYWLGFGSGSSESFLRPPTSATSSRPRHGRASEQPMLLVRGMRNAVVADSSALTQQVWHERGRRDTLAAGSAATAIDLGHLAAVQLIEVRAWVTFTDAQLRDELGCATEVLLTRRAALKEERLATLTEQQATAAECKARLAALQVLKHFAAANVVARPQGMRYMCTIVKAALLEQLRQPRAMLVAAACEVVLTLATYTQARAAWTLMSGWFVAALLRCTASTHPIVVTAARSALDASVMRPGLSQAALADILTACRAVHHRVRTHALRTLLTLLRYVQGTSEQLTMVTLYSVPLCHVIREACSDADALVRRLARMCFWALYAANPRTADELRGGMTSKLQQLLLQEKETVMNHIGVFGVAVRSRSPMATHTASQTPPKMRLKSGGTCTLAQREADINTATTATSIATSGKTPAGSVPQPSLPAPPQSRGCEERAACVDTRPGDTLHDELQAIAAQRVRRAVSARVVRSSTRPTTATELAGACGGHVMPTTPYTMGDKDGEHLTGCDDLSRRGSHDAARLDKDDSAQQRVLTWVSALYTASDTQTRCSALRRCVDALWQRPHEWGEEACDGLLICLDRCGSEAHEPSYMLRRRSFAALRAILAAPAFSLRLPSLARQLTRVLLLCRAGLDDAYVEVQQEAALALHAVIVNAGLPRDMCVHSLVVCLTRWHRGPARDDVTVGRLALLNALGRCLLVASVTTHADAAAQRAAHTIPSADGGGGTWVSDIVVQRALTLVESLRTHPAPDVRLSANRVATLLQRACQSHSAPPATL